jgi:hypothetical protein
MDGEVEYDPEWSTTHLVLNTIFSAVFAGAVAVLVTAVIERWVLQPGPPPSAGAFPLLTRGSLHRAALSAASWGETIFSIYIYLFIYLSI